MAVVVRCTGCGGLARVGPEAVGLLVVCPRCRNPFLADPEPVADAAPPPPPPPPPPVRAMPVAPPQPRRRRPAPEVHDHPPPTAGGVPFSVIIGLALLPLAIPMLWLLGPFAAGTDPALSLATPVSLAVAASTLCLAVAYTVDWTPVTRIKGVLTLLGLSVFAGLLLHFMKRDWAEWLQNALGASDWHLFEPADGDYTIDFPGTPAPLRAGEDGPVPSLKPKSGYRLNYHKQKRVAVYTVAVGLDPDPGAGDPAWFAAVGESLKAARPAWDVGGGRSVDGVTLANREWEATKPGERQVVRVLRDRAKGRVYVLAVEGRPGKASDDDAARFLNSFATTDDD